MKLWNDRRLRLSITRLGLEFVAILFLLGVFAVNTGNNLLYLLFSLMLGLFLVSGWVSVRALKGLGLLSVEEGNVFARVRGGLRLRLLDTRPGRPRGLELRLTLDQGQVEPGFYAGGLGPDRELKVSLHLRPDRRGPCALRELEILTRYPFGLMEKSLRFPLDQSILVLPHPRAAHLPVGALGEDARLLPRPGVASPEGVRPFVPGDSPRRVHWKRTAQRGEPWVRTFEDEQPLGVRLRLDLEDWEPGPPFEKELERLSGAILQARIHRKMVCLEILDRHGHQVLDGFTPCWRALALCQARPRPDLTVPPPPGDLGRLD
jgi:uncharacterized protein (DUF58 family)